MSVTSKYKLAEQALRIISGGTPTNDAQVTMQEVMIGVSQAFGSVARNNYFEGKVIGEPMVNGNFIYTFDDRLVKKDTSKALYYADLPATTITLPYDMGVFQVSTMTDQSNAFVPLPNGFMPLFYGLDSSTLEGRIGYFVEDNRIYFPNMNAKNKVTKVLMKLVAPLGGIGDEDEINIPDDVQLEIVKIVIQMYAAERAAPHDEISDLVK